MTTEPRLQPGTELAGYRIRRFVARGGMGSVYEAVQLSLERRVALKFISEELGIDERFRARFRREARIAAAMDDPHILPVYEAGELPDGGLFLAMRFVEGPDLASLLREEGPMSVPDALMVLGQVAEALDAAHAHGLVHRDVKPANVMLDRRQGRWHAYLTDFGLAKPDEQISEHTATGELLGTVDYMAPELIEGLPFDARADVYSFGCMAYKCLTNQLPYRRETRAAAMMAHLNATIPRPSAIVAGIPPAADRLVEHALQKDPARRPHSAGALMRSAVAQMTAGDQATESFGDAPTELAVRPALGAHDRAARVPRPAPPAIAQPPSEQRGAPKTRQALVIAGLALLVAVAAAGVAFGLLARSNTTSPNADHGQSSRLPSSGFVASTQTSSTAAAKKLTTTSTSTAGSAAQEAVESENYEGPGYSAAVPVGWSTVEDAKRKPGYTESKWQNASEPADYALIDTSGPQGNGLTPAEEAAPVHRDLEHESGYEELAYSPIQLNGTPAQEWVFRVPGSERVDYFFQRCDIGFAVLGSAPAAQFQQWAATFRALASSVKGSCE